MKLKNETPWSKSDLRVLIHAALKHRGFDPRWLKEVTVYSHRGSRSDVCSSADMGSSFEKGKWIYLWLPTPATIALNPENDPPTYAFVHAVAAQLEVQALRLLGVSFTEMAEESLSLRSARQETPWADGLLLRPESELAAPKPSPERARALRVAKGEQRARDNAAKYRKLVEKHERLAAKWEEKVAGYEYRKARKAREQGEQEREAAE